MSGEYPPARCPDCGCLEDGTHSPSCQSQPWPPPALDRPCVACLHYRHETVVPEYPGEHVCTHSAVRLDVVTGRVVPHNVPCRDARGRDGRCGVSGVFWEPTG